MSQWFLIASHWFFFFFFSVSVSKVPYFQGYWLFLQYIHVLKAFEHSFQGGWEYEAPQKGKLTWMRELEDWKKKRKQRTLVIDLLHRCGLQLEVRAPCGRNLFVPSLHYKCNLISFFKGSVHYLRYTCKVFIRYQYIWILSWTPQWPGIFCSWWSKTWRGADLSRLSHWDNTTNSKGVDVQRAEHLQWESEKVQKWVLIFWEIFMSKHFANKTNWKNNFEKKIGKKCVRFFFTCFSVFVNYLARFCQEEPGKIGLPGYIC